MRAEVGAVVRALVAEARVGVRASYVAERAGVPVAAAREDLVRLAEVGDVDMRFEVMCPSDGRTVKTFGVGEELPATLFDFDCNGGEPFDVTDQLIWVSFTPSSSLRDEVERDAEQPTPKVAKLPKRRSPLSGLAPKKASRTPTPTRHRSLSKSSSYGGTPRQAVARPTTSTAR